MTTFVKKSKKKIWMSLYKYRAGLLLWALLTTNSVMSQYYESGTEPASVRWQQIQTENFRIIFPKGAAQDGQRAINVLEYILQAEGKTLERQPSKISVVLHNHTAFSNGFVSWAPKRSEWFLTPPQNNYAQNWLDQLALHEYRHVVQMDKLNQGLTKAMGFVVGQQAVGAVAGLVPLWFLEGDAVATETALTHAGRGRNPAFEMPLRTIALSENYQKYDKALFGSYKDHVPNHYEFGYQMVGWTRGKYGTQTFETSMNTVAQKPYLFPFYPFKLGIKKETGNYTGALYKNAFSDLTFRWNEQEMKTGYENVTPINLRKNNLYTNYRSPQFIDDTTFVALKTGMAQIAQLVKVDINGREQIIHTPGFINSELFSYSNGLLAWTEQVRDLRWSNRSYSIVKLFNMKTGMEKTLQQRTRYYAPTLSPDGITLAVVDVPVEGTPSIVILDLLTGEEEHLPNPAGVFFQTPAWCKDGKSLLVIVNNQDGKSIARIDVATGQFTTVLPPSFHDISHPVDGGLHAFFTGYYNGITNVYAVDYLTGKMFQVSLSRFGAFDPHPDNTGKHIVYADYSAKGYDLVKINLNPEKWTPAEQLTDYSLKLYETLAGQEGFNLQDSIVPEREHHIKPYRKWMNLLNVHSWAPLYYEVDVTDVTSMELYPGVVLLSQDLLGNLTASAGYSWQGHNAFHAGFTYKGLYPVFDFKIKYGGRNSIIGRPNDNQQELSAHDRMQIDIRSYIPFSFTRSRWITGITPQIRLLYNNSYLYSNVAKDFQYGMWDMSYSVQLYRYLKMSARDLSPRLGLVVQGAYKHAPWNDQLGYIFYMYGRAYLPGIAPHHSLRISGMWQKQETKEYLYSTWLNFPRGYSNNYRTEKLAIETIDYSLPLAYPDWNWSFLVYLKRLTANLFCDVAQNQYRAIDNASKQIKWYHQNLCSVGVDLLADVHLMQIAFPINIGIRTVYVPENSDVQPSLLMSVTF